MQEYFQHGGVLVHLSAFWACFSQWAIWTQGTLRDSNIKHTT